ncbi:centrosomal protein of 78 kDa [Osmerus mordax]|uniref:centrosomal protein of 78 kDa n=1 Tax=Osmerus mordax TaxID=8014 RepID=UPI0035102E2B
MLDAAQIRKRGGQDFGAYYDYACAMQDLAPSRAVKAHLSQGILDINGDRLKLTDWPPVFSTLAINRHLQKISISSSFQIGPAVGETDSRYWYTSRRRIPAIHSKELTFKLCKALRDCLSVSPNLKTLQLHGLPLRERDLITLTKGLAASVSVEHVSLAHCPIRDKGLEAICQSVKYSASVRTVDFTNCDLTWRGAEHMASIVKHQATQRHGAAWVESLRYRKPEFEGMGGLRRLTLNCNTLIGDRGATALAQELSEDLWVKALDLQKCGLSSDGARKLLEALKTNATLCVLDIRSNPLVDKVLVKTAIEKVLMNCDGQSAEFSWIKPPAMKEPHKPSTTKRRILVNTHRGKATFRIVRRRASLTGRRSPAVAPPTRPQPRPSKCIPWRAAARADRDRGLPPGIAGSKQIYQAAGTVHVNMEADSEEEEEDDEEETGSPSGLSLQERITVRQYRLIQGELEEIRLRLAEERRARVRTETRLMEYELENCRLRRLNFSLSEAVKAPPIAASSILEDEEVLESIESSFNKFHGFLDLLKDAGLGQLASMAGIDQSDFGPVGRPQLSSTVGQGLSKGVGSGDTDETQKGDGVPSERAVPRPSPRRLAREPPATPREFLPEQSPQEVPLDLASGPTGAPCVEESGGELDLRAPSPKQIGDLQVAGSEHSIQSNSSHGNGSHGKNSHGSNGKVSQGRISQSRHGNGNGSNRSQGSQSNGSHGYSLNYSNGSNAYSSVRGNSHRSNSSHGDMSARSSLSELSERAESVVSEGSVRAEGGGGGGQGGEEVGELYSGVWNFGAGQIVW